MQTHEHRMCFGILTDTSISRNYTDWKCRLLLPVLSSLLCLNKQELSSIYLTIGAWRYVLYLLTSTLWRHVLLITALSLSLWPRQCLEPCKDSWEMERKRNCRELCEVEQLWSSAQKLGNFWLHRILHIFFDFEVKILKLNELLVVLRCCSWINERN